MTESGKIFDIKLRFWAFVAWAFYTFALAPVTFVVVCVLSYYKVMLPTTAYTLLIAVYASLSGFLFGLHVNHRIGIRERHAPQMRSMITGGGKPPMEDNR